MPEPAADDDLPESLLKVILGLERITGRMPVPRTMALIVAVGLGLTTLLTTAVWWVERQRVQQEFTHEAAQFRVMVQDRLDHRSAMLHQVAIRSQESGKPVPAQALVEPTHGVAVVMPQELTPSSLSAKLGLGEHSASAMLPVVQCLQRQPSTQAVAVCPIPQGVRGGAAWLLAERVAAPRAGWAIAPLAAADLLDMPQFPSAMQLSSVLRDVSVQGPGDFAGSVPQGQGSLHRLTVGGHELSLAITGTWHAETWQEVLSRRAGMWIAAGGGVLFTLAALHMYMMLISTRRRARDMSRDMSVALHRTQSRNQAVMDTAPDAILMADADGNVQWCNQAVASIFGRTSQDLHGEPINLVLPSLGQGTLDEWFANHGFSNRVIGYETTGRRNEGVPFPVSVSASRAEVDGEFIQTFIVRDTTDAKWAEQELALRDRALASSADGVVIVSMTLPNQPMIYVNQAFEQMSGYEAHELLGFNCRLLHREDRDQPGLQTIRVAMKDGQGCQVVLRNYRKDGRLFYNDLAISPVLNPEGQLTHYVGVSTDITDRIAAEQVLKLRTERLNAVFDLSPDGFVVLDKRGEVSIVNPAFERMTGLLAADLVGQSLSAFEEHLMARCQSSEVGGQTAAGVMASAGDVEGGLSATHELLHMHTPSMRTLVRRVRHGEHDNETVMYFRDITHELEVDRMKSEFLAMAAHELRTPMVSIFGFTELLLKRQFTDERRNDMLSTIHRQASVLINLVNELLDLARIESRRGKDFKREHQQVQTLVENVVSGLLIHNDARKVAYTLSAAPIWVDVDREKFSLALTNVLSNAYKYSPHGGEISLDMVWRERDQRSECGIRVTDQGLGMTPEQVEKVFDRFFRADTSGNIPGTGLGMTIVKEILELHGGQVTVASELGKGTTVTLWVPLLSSAASPECRGEDQDEPVRV